MSKRPLHLENPRLYIVYYKYPSLLSPFSGSLHAPKYMKKQMDSDKEDANKFYAKLLEETDEKTAEYLKAVRRDNAHTLYMIDIANDYDRPFHDVYSIVNYDEW